jgi:integrase
MGRQRKDGDPLGLAGTRLTPRRGKFWYRHRATELAPERWEDFGTDLTAAKDRARLFNEPGSAYGTVGYWLDLFVIDCEARVKASTLAQRTLEDYTTALVELKPYFGSMLIQSVKPSHVSAYLDVHAQAGRPVQANREKAALSSCISWVLRRKDCPPGLAVNPCMRKSGVTRNEETKRERYVEDAEYQAVFAAASKSVKLMMELTFRTLQRPESDIIRWTPAIIKRKGSDKVLHFRQGKTGRLIDIGLHGRLLELIESAAGAVPVLHQPIVHNLRGDAYTYDGISTMLKKAIAKVRLEHAKKGGPLANMPSFGFRDLKGKGATDMWLAGTDIKLIQQLCGHADAKTTEIYVKARWRETAKPNLIAI